jgi:hypothetical protein
VNKPGTSALSSCLMALVLVACESAQAPPKEPEVCSLTTSQAALTAADRKIVGEASGYPADGLLRAREAELAGSQKLRRELGWSTIAKVIAPVPLSEPLPNVSNAAIPRFQTWYDLGDLRRVFHELYGALPLEQKRARSRFPAESLDNAFEWNLVAVDGLPNWPAERYQQYLEDVSDASEVNGLAGISRVAYSPGAARHLLRSYPEILECRSSGPPPERELGPVQRIELAREPFSAAACETTAIGTYAVKEDESLQVTLEEGDAAELILRSESKECRTAPGSVCTISGPATVDVLVNSERAVESVVTVYLESQHPPWSACLDGAFPNDAVVIKADYRRADFELTMPKFSTSADALEQRLTGEVSWDLADGEVNPTSDDIYTLTLPNGAHYRLAALHVMTKELDHWLWVTLFWSESPDSDFGADRPASLAGPWANYKMCAVTAFEEQDLDPSGGYSQTHPSLGEALKAVYAGPGTPSWCSNPYIELGHGNADSNCIGCHQHAGTKLRSEDVLALPGGGNTLLRNNFPTDYSWAVTQGDALAQVFSDEETYYLGSSTP